MRYAEFCSQGLFVGSGVVEAGCKTIIGQRLKLSDMHWTVKGANAIIALRCCQMSNCWEEILGIACDRLNFTHIYVARPLFHRHHRHNAATLLWPHCAKIANHSIGFSEFAKKEK